MFQLEIQLFLIVNGLANDKHKYPKNPILLVQNSRVFVGLTLETGRIDTKHIKNYLKHTKRLNKTINHCLKWMDSDLICEL